MQSILWSKGMAYAPVLPEPVLALASMSRPSRINGMAVSFLIELI
jgi:hypothetical protein